MTDNYVGTIYDNTNRVVVVNMGARGPKGLTGQEGPEGEQGDSINVRGAWASGTTYAPLDAVGARSSAVVGATSLFIQFSSYPTSLSVTEPHLDPARWTEVGATDVNGSFGGVWQIEQSGHPFSKVGQPAALGAAGYVLASSADINSLAVGVVREIIDANRVILQSTGGISGVDNSISNTGNFEEGELYYVSPVAGFLQSFPPNAAGQFSNPIYKADGSNDGVVLPWTPVQVDEVKVAIPIVRGKFYYTAIGGETDFSGEDENGNTPDFVGASVDAFQNGLNLSFNEYTNDDTTLILTTPAAAGDTIEIWLSKEADRGLQRWNKADNLAFDGLTRQFPLLFLGSAVPASTSSSFIVSLDGCPQEPDVDYTISNVNGDAFILFTFAPDAETGSWVTYGEV